MACFWPGYHELSATPPKSIVLSIKAAGSHNRGGSLRDTVMMGATQCEICEHIIKFIYNKLSSLYYNYFF